MKVYDKSTVKSSIGDDLSSLLVRGWMWLLAGLMTARDMALEVSGRLGEIISLYFEGLGPTSRATAADAPADVRFTSAEPEGRSCQGAPAASRRRWRRSRSTRVCHALRLSASSPAPGDDRPRALRFALSVISRPRLPVAPGYVFLYPRHH
ncbi:hypothetical protein SKAU_G00226350 [Synaphobranchus kaupii]|uniref:Uncharacterized protein n=1 Tax=Synaphobranchus kaupii TaxID=118154 RepID=A0A9Q1ISU5_SYNKA|nr:hypothetical protein SKAU_G00226350 [Synaphobranchus kaupii]